MESHYMESHYMESHYMESHYMESVKCHREVLIDPQLWKTKVATALKLVTKSIIPA